VIALIDEGIAGGITQSKACKVIGIDERRIQRWRKQAEEGRYMRKPGTGLGHIPFNALTKEENELVLSMIASREHADDSARVLSIKAMEEHGIYVSHVTFHSRMADRGVNGPRGIYAKRRSRHSKPDTGRLTGPNQLWAWDISYIKTTTRYQSYYLYALLDCWSRKVIAWHISEFLNSDEVQTLWDKGLLNEGIYGSDKPFPRSLCDRGSQMRSTSTKAFFTALGVQQYFSRPKTPNDNPQIESLFSTVKNNPAYPERFGALAEAEQYFMRFFDWYNHEHYHTGIGMVTPVQRHTGRDIEIFKEREAIKQATLQARRLANCRIPKATVSR
jgi:putative transposase